MKTDDLISVLSRQAEAVDPRAPIRRLLLASLLGVAAALPLMLWRLGINPGLAADTQVPMFWIKWGFVVLVVGASAVLVARLARPGVDVRHAAQAVATPLLALWGLAAVVLFAAAPAERMPLVMGSSWSSCPLNIALLSLPALVLLLAAVRTLAPTRLRQAGAATGSARRGARHARLPAALPRTRGAVPGDLVRARDGDPGRHRRRGRAARAALVIGVEDRRRLPSTRRLTAAWPLHRCATAARRWAVSLQTRRRPSPCRR